MPQTNPRKGVLKRLAELEKLCEGLTVQVEELTAERNRYRENYEDTLVENIRLQEKLTEIRERLRQYEPLEVKETVPMEVASADTLVAVEESLAVDCFADLPLKVAVIGGTDAWQAKVMERHPGFKVIGSSKNFDRDKLSGTDILVINTNAVSHACTQKAKGEVDRGTEVLTISTNNLDILDKKIMAILA
ncbi:hypothetical protein SAMN05216582_10957 [Selenomonas ruminantium]|uniref:DUF2325 domain-containing protein n=1 Tax=Selenomonas ruminantium TaxID=971 RepID=A0A1M6TV51_SELRU|nr:hypothetical protein [Selenomonas ruminantium]SHK60773.1 hypothetical protein SAMN05216582_10957 [Selenomonas ruminantium]